MPISQHIIVLAKPVTGVVAQTSGIGGGSFDEIQSLTSDSGQAAAFSKFDNETNCDLKHSSEDGLEIATRIVEQLEEIDTRRQQSINDLRMLALELAIATTAKILMQEISEDRFPFEAIIEEMSNYSEDEKVTVYLNPQTIEKFKSRLAGSDGLLEKHQIRLEKDSGIGRGGCRVESKRFDIFRDPFLQIEQIRQTVMETINDASIERRNTNASNSRLQRFPERRSAS